MVGNAITMTTAVGLFLTWPLSVSLEQSITTQLSVIWYLARLTALDKSVDLFFCGSDENQSRNSKHTWEVSF